jgi:TPR repeat protein
MDYAESIKWYRLAAAQGHVKSQVNLGVVYYRGDVVPQDMAEAIKWYQLAAEQGNGEAQYNLGVIYANGEGVQQDLVKGSMWMILGVENSDPRQKGRRAKMLNFTSTKMSPDQIAEAKSLASKCRENKFKGC